MQPAPAKDAIERAGDPATGLGLVVFVFLTFRLFGLIMLQYGGLFGGSSDFDYYFAMGQQTDRGLWPYLQYWSEYPPIFPWLIVGTYHLAEFIAGAPPSSDFFESLLRAALLPFDLGNLLLIYALAHRMYAREVALRAAWIYTGLFAPVLIWLGWFEPLPIFWMLLSLWLLVNGRYAWAGAATGIGIVTKIIPGLIALLALRIIVGARRHWGAAVEYLRFAVPCAVAASLICLPFLLLNPSIFVVSVRAWFSRLPWETFWAVADGYDLFGIVPSLASRTGWPTYATPALYSPAWSNVSLLALITILGILSWYGGAIDRADGLPRYPTARQQVGLAGTLYAGLLLVSSGFSPQFVAWVIPFAVLITPGLGGLLWVSALTFTVLLGERFLYYTFVAPSSEAMLAIVAARSVLFAGLLLEFGHAAGATWLRGWPVRRPLGAAVTVVTLTLAVAIGLHSYASSGGSARREAPARIESDEIHRVTDPLDPILVFDVAEYRRLGPWLGDRPLYLLGPDRFADRLQTETTMRTLAERFGSVIVLGRGAPSSAKAAVDDWLRSYAIPLDQATTPTGLTLRRYALPDHLAWPGPSPQTDQFAQFGNAIELLGHSRQVVRDAAGASWLRLTLYWRPLRPIERPLEVTFRLLNPDGQVKTVIGTIGQSYPVTAWRPGEVVIETEDVLLDHTGAPDSIRVGWLDPSSGQALVVAGHAATETTVELRTMP